MPVGSPNCDKTTLFNALTGLRAKTGNYPGVTVSRYEDVHKLGDVEAITEDLPGTYFLDLISPGEEAVTGVLDAGESVHSPISGRIMLTDAIQLHRGLGMLVQVQQRERPTVAVLTFIDELVRQGSSVGVDALSWAVGVQVILVASGDKRGIEMLSKALAKIDSWSVLIAPSPIGHEKVAARTDSVLENANCRAPDVDKHTRRIDKVLPHPLWGTLISFVMMYAFSQIIFTVVAPINDAFEGFFVQMGGTAKNMTPIDWLGSLIGDGIFAGVGAVVTFVPQITLLFPMIALLEGSGYLSRAVFLIDRMMGVAGLERRVLAALLSSVACATPGTVATRTLPSAEDRIATMMGALLMTCSTRLPMYTLTTGIMVPGDLF